MRIRSFLPILLCFFVTHYASGQGFLKVKGKLIVNEKGQKVILRGMGLGGDMLQEGYMFKVAMLNQQYKIRAGIQDLVGPEKPLSFTTPGWPITPAKLMWTAWHAGALTPSACLCTLICIPCL
jgi:hypothetical protein